MRFFLGKDTPIERKKRVYPIASILQNYKPDFWKGLPLAIGIILSFLFTSYPQPIGIEIRIGIGIVSWVRLICFAFLLGFSFFFRFEFFAKMRGHDQQSRVFYELCALLLSILRPSPPPPLPMPYSSSASSMAVSSSRRTEVSPAGFASLLLGVSLALMLCGSVTFVIGFILMPWVLGMVMVFYLVGLISNLSCLGRTILLGNQSTTHRAARKEMQGQFFSKLPIL